MLPPHAAFYSPAGGLKGEVVMHRMSFEMQQPMQQKPGLPWIGILSVASIAMILMVFWNSGMH
jgi:hypothetical protein